MQRAVRTYPEKYTNAIDNLNRCLEQGYKAVMCNPFYVDGGLNGLEYILEKEDEHEQMD